MNQNLSEAFSRVTDPRMSKKCKHKLSDILFIGFCTLLSNGEDFEDMVEFGKERRAWLSAELELPNGIPSHDTFNRVFQIIDPQVFMDVLQDKGEALLEIVKDKLVSLDGKKIKGASPRSRGNQGLYVLSAWVGEERLCIGQRKVDDKSNEITAIPELIDSLDLEGSTVSIDAIGCQLKTAQKIKQANADYLLAVKKNQGNLFDELNDDYIWTQAQGLNETWEYGHGRYETRRCMILPAQTCLSPDLLSQWEGIKTLVKIIAQREENGVTSTQSRYYISSQEKIAQFYNDAVREHWSIENQLHWHLDVTFNEDASRSRKGNAPINLNIMRKVCLQRIALMDDKLSFKKRRYKASMNVEYLRMVIGL